jgi:hypothetical protein
MRMILGALMLAAVLGVGAARAADQAVTVAGTRIALTPPPGFVPATKFVGLTSQAPGASFNVTESLPGSYPKVRQSVTRSNELAQRGLSLIDVQFLTDFPYEHVLAQATLKQEGVTVDVWLLAFRHAEIAGTVVATLARVPSPPATAAAMRAALSTVRVVAATAGGLTAQLPFAVDVPARFAFRNALAGRQLILKETPPPSEGAVGDVIASVTLVSRDPVKPPEREIFARQQLFGLSAVQVDAAEEPVPVTIGGLPGLEILGQGRSASGQPRRIYFVAVFAPKRAYTIVALGQPNRIQAALPDLRALARSFKTKP